jgi:YfiH family protein
MYRLDDDQVLRVPAFEALSWLEHGFGTKLSGVWPLEDERATLRQIHSTVVAVADRAGVLGEGDALVSNQPGLFVAVKTADCIPVLLVDPERRTVAAIHAGWRGTAGNIVRSTIDTLVSEFHTDPEMLWAAIGPGIRKCCYEVSGEVAEKFAAWLPEHAGAANGAMLDLTEVNRRQLVQAGLDVRHVFGPTTADWCTRCEPDTLHSFRRDGGAAGRMYSAIRIQL